MLYLEVPDDDGVMRYLNCDHISMVEDHELGCIIYMLDGTELGLKMAPVDFLGSMQEARETGMTAIRPEMVEITAEEVEPESSTVN